MIYKEITGYENLYLISNIGDVVSIKNSTKNNYFILKPEKIKSGYHRVKLFKKGISEKILVHRIVANEFIDNPSNKKYVNHKDGNKINNNVDNLEWVTAKENTRHAYDKGLKNVMYGESSPRSKINFKIANEIRKLHLEKGYSHRYLAKIYNVSKGCISPILNNKRWI